VTGSQTGRQNRAISCAALVLILSGAQPLAAQVLLSGRVIEDDSLQAVAGARVSLFDLFERFLASATTDARGRFQFSVEKASAVRIRVQRIGYKETLTPVLRFDRNKSLDVEVRVRTDAVILAPLEVTAVSATAGNRFFSGFEQRRQRGMRVFFTREDIERRKPAYVTDLIASVPGVHVSGSGTGSRRVVTIGRNNCPAQVYVDGFFVNVASSMSLDEVVGVKEIEGIEVYSGLGTVPAEFLSSRARCGVIVVWTRRK